MRAGRALSHQDVTLFSPAAHTQRERSSVRAALLCVRRLRISLGLKPLSMTSSAANQAEEASRRHKEKEKQREQEDRAKKFKDMQAE